MTTNNADTASPNPYASTDSDLLQDEYQTETMLCEDFRAGNNDGAFEDEVEDEDDCERREARVQLMRAELIARGILG